MKGCLGREITQTSIPISPRHRKVSSFEIYREKILNPRNVADMGAESKSQVADRIVWFMHV